MEFFCAVFETVAIHFKPVVMRENSDLSVCNCSGCLYAIYYHESVSIEYILLLKRNTYFFC